MIQFGLRGDPTLKHTLYAVYIMYTIMHVCIFEAHFFLSWVGADSTKPQFVDKSMDFTETQKGLNMIEQLAHMP